MKRKNLLSLSAVLLCLLFSSCTNGNLPSSETQSSSSLLSSSLSSLVSSEASSTESSSSKESSVSSAVSSQVVSSSSSQSSSSSSLSSSISDVKPEKISFYSLNDVHGAIEETPNSSTYFPGMSKLSYKIKNDADYSPSSVLLSSGDMFQGSALSNISEGLCMTDIMSKMGFASMAIGNHEFDWGTSKIVTEEQHATFPFLGINIYSKSTGKIASFASPSTIVRRGGAKIGIIGSIMQNIAGDISAKMIADISFEADVPLVTAEAKRLKTEEKCDLVIVSTHQGPDSATDSYLESSYVDGVFGGHDHQKWENQDSNGKYYLESSSSGRALSKMVFTLTNGSYQLSTASAEWNDKGTISGTDPEVDKVIADYNEEIKPLMEKVVGYRDGPFCRNSSSSSNSGSLGNLVTKAMMFFANDSEYGNDSTVVASFHNTGGVRADWTSTTKDASTGLYPITIGDLYSTSPFDNLVQAIEVSGSNFILAAKSDYHSDNVTLNGYSWYVNGTKVDSSATYRVVTIDYLITKSGDPLYKGLDGGENINGNQAFMRDVLAAYLQRVGTIHISDYPYL
ncbi:MAG: 5'-nucleotidase C-terminal domain-containing protein [Bacilli bacterium]|jgi:2',3'-cyclic-nucleotide 2'-phosphodiesterase (5'-nucleotidase family)|nr:5'-nucleotidase C-terminal domain-containing protein [Bacilli bacterium]